ncbi:MAG TPA: helix-turn-helix domain-containing protein [Solirubrobacteraceae bacterium]|nr:helix-turn-helix domain-containing protein [Solirubrobacteraceae bacterium]
MSPVTFRQAFGGVEEAFAYLIQQMTERVVDLIREGFARERSWSMGAVSGIESLVSFFDAEPSLARAWLVEAHAGPAAALEQRLRLLAPLVTLIDDARKTIPARRQPPEFAAEAIVASLIGVLHARLITRRAPPFVEALGELSALLVGPFLGLAAAKEASYIGEARSRASARASSAAPTGRSGALIPRQLKHARARRALECLLYIAAHPGASNRDIAMGVGISHHGQVSALLARLQATGALVKITGGAGRPNAWRLSSSGQELTGWLLLYSDS